MIYAVSQLVAAMNAGRQDLSPIVRLTAYDLLVSTNRHAGGGDYDQLQKAFERLAGTRITTDIRTNGVRQREGFGIIDGWKIIEKHPANGRMVAVELRLSDWLYDAIVGREVLTLSRDYFRLSGGLERRLYELARKHCGYQSKCLECFSATLGGILLALGMARASNALAILAVILWVSSFEPLVKVVSGTALGIRYEYAYLFGGIEPRFKTDFGSYLTLPPWKRMIFHLSGTVGSPLGAALVAVIGGERVPIAAWVSWIVFWIVISINAAAILAGLARVRRIRGFRIAETSGGLAAVELRSLIQGGAH